MQCFFDDHFFFIIITNTIWTPTKCYPYCAYKTHQTRLITALNKTLLLRIKHVFILVQLKTNIQCFIETCRLLANKSYGIVGLYNSTVRIFTLYTESLPQSGSQRSSTTLEHIWFHYTRSCFNSYYILRICILFKILEFWTCTKFSWKKCVVHVVCLLQI